MSLLRWFKTLFKSRYKNWSADIDLRYLPIVKIIKSEEIPRVSILEVGSGSLGITPYLKKAITGVDINFGGPQTSMVNKVYASAEKLPFPDSSFDYVICVDVLEHIEPVLRKNVIAELLRVGKKKIFLGVPCGKNAEEEDLYTSRLFLSVMGYNDSYLEDHIRNRLPTKREILDMLEGTEVKVLKNVNLLLHRYIMKTQISKRRLFNFISGVINIMLIPIFSQINWGKCYRYIFVVKKNK